MLTRTLCILDPQTRLLIVKDFRTFRRDPAQWAQILIFLALAVLYFSNIRRFYEQEIGRAFQNGISLLNLVAISFPMCAYTGRFIFPMLSLEGRKFWILGLLPVKREQLLWGKFAFSTTGGLVLAEALVLLSARRDLFLFPAVFFVVAALLGLAGVLLNLLRPKFYLTFPVALASMGVGNVILAVAFIFCPDKFLDKIIR